MLDNRAPSAFAFSTKVLENLSSRIVARDLASKFVLFALPVRYDLSPRFLECLVCCYRRTAEYSALIVAIEMLCKPDLHSLFSTLLTTHMEEQFATLPLRCEEQETEAKPRLYIRYL